jgi:hypothetical protein
VGRVEVQVADAGKHLSRGRQLATHVRSERSRNHELGLQTHTHTRGQGLTHLLEALR